MPWAGRCMSRRRALEMSKGRDIQGKLANLGIIVSAQNKRTIAEEMPEVYKNVSEVINVCVESGISKKVVQLRPLGCVTG